MHLVDNLKEMQKMLRGIEPDYSDVKSAGMEFFNLQQAKSISEYMFTRYDNYNKLGNALNLKHKLNFCWMGFDWEKLEYS